MQRGVEHSGAGGSADLPHCLHADLCRRWEGQGRLPGILLHTTVTLCNVFTFKGWSHDNSTHLISILCVCALRFVYLWIHYVRTLLHWCKERKIRRKRVQSYFLPHTWLKIRASSYFFMKPSHINDFPRWNSSKVPYIWREFTPFFYLVYSVHSLTGV